MKELKHMVYAQDGIVDLNLVLKEKSTTVVPGQVLTIVGSYEQLSANITQVDGNPFVKVFFGIAECCENCRKGLFHHNMEKSRYQRVFVCADVAYEDSTKDKPLLPPKTENSQPVKSEEVTQVPVLDAILAFLDIYWLIGENYYKGNGKILYFGRYLYTLFEDKGDKTFLCIEEKFERGCGTSQTRFNEKDMVPLHRVQPLMDYYRLIESDIKRVKTLSAEIQALYTKIVGDTKDGSK